MPRDGARLEALLQSQHRVLGIYVTFRCPLTCAHCGVDSHPRREERIDPTLALEQIEKAARGGAVHALHLNGGEPFLERKLLAAISEKARDLDLDLAITTSGHWATSLDRARKILEELPVLTQMLISTDQYHLPFVDLSVVANAARAAAERGVLTQIGICTRTGESDEFVERVRAVLGPDLVEEVELLIFPLDPVGRAEFLPEAHWRREAPEWPAGRCHQLNRPVLLHDGSVSACCNTQVTHRRPGPNPLKLGNCRERGIDELLATVDDNYYIQMIRAGGPALLAQIAAARGAELPVQRFRSGDICQLCDVILHDAAAQRVLAEAFADPVVQRQVAVWRAAALDELHMLNRFVPQPPDTARASMEGSLK
jgi:hypothetical protein